MTFFQKLMQEQASEPWGVEAWFTDHPLTQDRIADVKAMIAKLPAEQLRRLAVNAPAFQEFKGRVKSLPAPPPSTATKTP